MPILACVRVRVYQSLQLLLATDERRVEPACVCRRVRENLVELPGSPPSVLRERRRARAGASRRRAGPRPRVRVPRAGRPRSRLPPTTCRSSPGAESTCTSPVLTPMRASMLRSRSASWTSRAARTARSASSSCSSGTPKTAMHGIADELLDRAAVALDRLAHGVEVARHQSAIDLGVQLRGEPRRIDEIAEQDGHGAPVRSAGRDTACRCSAPSEGSC